MRLALEILEDDGSRHLVSGPDAILAALAEGGVLEVEESAGGLGVDIRFVSPWKEAK